MDLKYIHPAETTLKAVIPSYRHFDIRGEQKK